mgnify:CR=1 FL=1
MSNFIPLKDLEVYQLSRELSKIAWEIYENLNWQDKKIMGDQFIEAVDSVGANIAEGYGRFHYLDRIKFYYNSRGSFNECNNHWLELLNERKKVDREKYKKFRTIAKRFSIKFNNFITSTYKVKENINRG